MFAVAGWEIDTKSGTRGDAAEKQILIPTIGYGMLAALAAHVYSRYALRRLRQLARGGEGGGDA